jgi:VWFA-related protein
MFVRLTPYLTDLNLLGSLDMLLEEGSVAAAARRLGLGPSATSRTLAHLTRGRRVASTSRRAWSAGRGPELLDPSAGDRKGVERDDEGPQTPKGNMARFLLVVALTFLPSIGSVAGDDPRQGPALQFPAAAESVIVDFVVRDKQGALLQNLDEGEVEVYEDGKRQRVDWLRRVERSPIRTSAENVGGGVTGRIAASGSSSRDGESERPYTALVFDRLGPTARVFACQQALAWLSKPRTPSWIGVFVADQVLETVLPFTNDIEAVRRAVEKTRTLARAPHNVRDSRERLRNMRMMSGRYPDSATVRPEFGAEMSVLAAEVEGDLEAEGRTTLGAQLSIVNALATVPGRKAVILFSEGLSLSSTVEPVFQSLVAGANRANVSIYAMDAAGLRTVSGNEDMRRALLGVGQTMEGTEGGGSNWYMLTLSEQMRTTPEGGLGRLAAETGGFLARDTNGFGQSLKRVDEDLTSYFVLAYSPTNANFDGRFRRIQIKVRHPHGSMQARQGYFAVRSRALPTPLLANEAPALALLEHPEGMSALPIRLLALEIPVARGDSHVVALAEIDSKSVRSIVDTKTHLYRQDYTIVYVFRDRAGRIVRKLSQRFRVNGEANRLDDARKAKTLSYRRTELPPGSYTVEAAAWDALGGAGGVARSTLQVSQAPDGQPKLGSLMVLRQAEPAGNSLEADHPLRYGSILLYPNLGEPVSRRLARQIAFFVAVRTDRPLAAKVVIASMTEKGIELPLTSSPPDADGIAHFVGSLPIDTMTIGDYDIRLTIGTQDTETRHAAFSIVD